MTIPDSLKRALQSGTVVPFIGSGVSLGVKEEMFPTWPKLIDELATELENECKEADNNIVRAYIDKGDLFKAAGAALEGLGRGRFDQFIAKRFGQTQPNDANLTIPQQIWRIANGVVITSNYDDVLQWAAPDANVVCNHQSSELGRLFSSGVSRSVWHLHGHHSTADSLILAPSQYQHLYGSDSCSAHSNYKAALQQLSSVLANKTLIFIGFGLHDEYVMAFVKEILERFSSAILPTFAIGTQQADEAESLWETYNVQVVPVANYGQAYVELLEQMVDVGSSAATSKMPAELTSQFDPDNQCFSVPYRRKGENVVGRDGVLEELRQALKSAASPLGCIVGIHGIGGLGKTQLAVEYSYEYKAQYPSGVVWLEADSDIDSQLIQLAISAKWAHPDTDPKSMLAIATHRIRASSGTLLIFDNVSAIDEIRDYLPNISSDPDILITSHGELPGVTSVPIDVLSEQAAVAMLNSESKRAFPSDDKTAFEIVNTLSRLPLAIELAGGYLRYRKNVSLKIYIDELENDLSSTVALASNHITSFVGHDANLRKTLSSSQNVLAETPIAGQLVRVLTWSGNAPMSFDLLRAIVNVKEAELLDALSVCVALRILEQSSVSSSANGSFRLRRLIARIRREEQGGTPPDGFATDAVRRMCDWFEKRRLEYDQLNELESQIDHLSAWEGYARSLAIPDTARLIWLQAFPPYHRGQYDAAKGRLQAAKEILDGLLPTEINKQTELLKAHVYNDFGAIAGHLGAGTSHYAAEAREIRTRLLAAC